MHCQKKEARLCFVRTSNKHKADDVAESDPKVEGSQAKNSSKGGVSPSGQMFQESKTKLGVASCAEFKNVILQI